MAQKIQTLLIDDLDGSAAEDTVRFGLDGTEYEIDLNARHARQLRDAPARYVNAARRIGRSVRVVNYRQATTAAIPVFGYLAAGRLECVVHGECQWGSCGRADIAAARAAESGLPVPAPAGRVR